MKNKKLSDCTEEVINIDHPNYSQKTFDKIIQQCNHLENGCVIFTGCKDNDGYGKIGTGSKHHRKNYLVHRWMYEYLHGIKLKKEICICHTCDTPNCINYSHLFCGTHLDNMQDKVNKNRQAKGFQIKKKKKLTSIQIKEIQTYSGPQKDLVEKFGISLATLDRYKYNRHKT